MLDSIIDIVKDQAFDLISKNADIPGDKKDKAVETATDSVMQGLKDNFNLGNISQLTALWGEGTAASGNPIVSNISNTVASALSDKVGLPKFLSSTVATSLVSAVIGALTGKGNSSGGAGFNIQSLIEAFTGGDSGKKGGGLLGSLGNIFK